MIYLKKNLLGGFCKGQSPNQTGQSRGGKYAARVQIGIEKDGSPQYRYFKTTEEYTKYLEGAGRKKERKAAQEEQGKELESKVKRERKASKKKQDRSEARQQGEKRKKRSVLLGGKTEDDKDKDVEKSFYLYLGV